MSDNAWNILTVTRSGVVSLLTGLSEDVARAAAQKLSGDDDPWTVESAAINEAYHVWSRVGGGRSLPLSGTSWGFYHDCDIKRMDAWGPGGDRLDIWPKPLGWPEFVAQVRALATLPSDDDWRQYFSTYGTSRPDWIVAAAVMAAFGPLSRPEGEE